MSFWPTQNASDTGHPKEPLVTRLFLLVQGATFAYFLAIGALIPVLPRFTKGPLGGGDVAVGLSIGSFALSAVLLRPFVGRISDRRGRRILMVAGAGAVALSTAFYLVATSLPILLLLRIISGAGEAGFYVGAATVINDIAPDERRGEALSFFSLALFAGIAVGPALGELVLGSGGFGAVWVVSALASGLAAVFATKVSETRPPIDPDAKPPPLIHPAGLIPGVILGSIICGLAGFDSFVPLYALQLGLSGSGAIFLLFSGIVLSIRSLGARLPDRLGHHNVARVGLITTATGLMVISAWGTTAGLFAGTAIFAMGHALSFPALMSLAVSSAPAAERGAVIGTFTAWFDLAFGSGAIGLGIVASTLGYRGSFASAAIIATAGFFLLLFYGRRQAAVGFMEEGSDETPKPTPASRKARSPSNIH
ncbi:MAG: MFS transporter [Actinobacteria bacterium]|nr:MFS transporter [Actinomycetota bacterium]